MNDFEQKIMKYLEQLEPGKVVNISGSDNYEQFVAATKKYIDQHGAIEFNSDLSKIRKV